jgi:hypothetical protein
MVSQRIQLKHTRINRLYSIDHASCHTTLLLAKNSAVLNSRAALLRSSINRPSATNEANPDNPSTEMKSAMIVLLLLLRGHFDLMECTVNKVFTFVNY